MTTDVPQLTIERADDISALSDFSCGLKSMDDFIHNRDKGLQLYVKLGITNLWIVKESQAVVALFALSKNVLRLSSSDKSVLDAQGVSIEESIFESKETYPSIEIDYIAVSKDYSHKKIGSFLINAIAKRAVEDDFSATMFITVEAIDTKEYSAVPFYRKCDFKDSEHGLIRNQNMQIYGEESLTRRMYRPIYRTT